MRTFIFITLVFVMCQTASAQTQTEGSARRIAEITVPQSVTDWGVSLMTDSIDSVYVRIDFPLASSSGAKRDSVEAEISAMQSAYLWRDSGVTGRYRIRWIDARRVIERIAALIGQ